MVAGRTRARDGRSVAVIGTRGYPSYYGGFETAVRKLAPYLADQGWNVTVYGRKEQIRLDDPKCDQRVFSIVTPGIDSNAASTLSYGFTAVMHAIFRRPDVVLMMNVANGYWVPLLKLRRIPVVINVDGIEWHRAKWGKLAKKVFFGGAKLTAKFGDHLVFDAKAIADFWELEFNRNGTFIPYGGDQVDRLPVEPGLKPNGYVLVVARFVPENTIQEFVEAAVRLAEDYDIVIVGSGAEGSPIQTQVRSLAESSSRVQWLGHISDDRRLYSLWQHAGVYFHGHSVGGTNPALVQAMACGANVVARDTVYNREVLGEAGTFTSSEPSAIEEQIRSMMTDRVTASRNRDLARRRAASDYAWSDVNAAYERVISDHLSSRFRE